MADASTRAASEGVDGGINESQYRHCSVDPAMKESVVVVVGKPKSGKTTALNNIFHLKLKSCASPHPTTQLASKKYRVKRRNGRDIIIFDTRSLNQFKFKNSDTIKDWDLYLGEVDFTLLYCLSVAPNSTITEEDRSIIDKIHWLFGYGVWNKCVLLLTFSDTAKRELFNSAEDTEAYKKHLQAHAEAFHSLLMDCGAVVWKSRLIFDYCSQEHLEKIVIRNLVAVPVGKHDNCVDIIPGLSSEGRQWSDYAFHEIQKKSCKRQIRVFSFNYHYLNGLGTFTACMVLGMYGGYHIGTVLFLLFPVIGFGLKSSDSSVDIKMTIRLLMMVLSGVTLCGWGSWRTLGSAIRSWWCGSRMVQNERELLCTHKFRRLENYFIQ